MNQEKITQAKELIHARAGNKPALMCSFGKDSMALLHLARETLGKTVPVICYRHPSFPAKWEFANDVIKSWGLTVHDYPPMTAGIKAKEDRLELVARYEFGKDGTMDLPMNTLAPVARRDFICGLNDWVLRPKAGLITFPWETVFMGHKSSDVDPYEGPVPLKTDSAEIGGVDLVFPLRAWSDADIWDYIEANHVPYDKRRYQDRAELPDKWLNPDYIHACTACIDPRNKAKSVFCPLVQTTVRNMGAHVLRLDTVPHYIEKEEGKYAVSST